MKPAIDVRMKEAGLRVWEILSQDDLQRCQKNRPAGGTACSLAEQTVLLVGNPAREVTSRYAEAVGYSREGFGRVEVESGYNLGYAIDMG